MQNIVELRRRSIDPTRVAGVTPIIYADGARHGVRAFNVRNATGLSATFVADRALDASELLYCGIPLTWYGPGNAMAAPALDPSVDAFDRTFFGGLVTTCGMDAFGPPGHDRWGSWSQHGHMTHLEARDIAGRVRWDEPEPFIELTGTIMEFRMFGAALRVERVWRIGLNHNCLSLTDRVTNDGSGPVPHMLLYHCNIGHPLLAENTSWSLDSSATRPRDATAAEGLARWNQGGPPQANFAEQVFIHVPQADERGWARARATNPDLLGGTSLTITFRREQLPALFSWRMLGYGTYVMAVEPANCPEVRGRTAAAAAGNLPMLQPGEVREYQLLFSVENINMQTARHLPV